MFGGTAEQGIHYFGASNAVLISAGQLRGTVTLVLADDDITPEANRIITVTASEPSEASIRNGVLQVIIKDNDPIATLGGFSQSTISEGSFTTGYVYLDRPSNHESTFTIQTRDLSTSSLDYIVPSSVTVPAGIKVTRFDVRADDDSLFETSIESFRINLVNNADGRVSNARTINIRDNDAPPKPYWKLPSQVVREGESTFLFIVAGLQRPAAAEVAAKLSLGGNATPGVDYRVIGMDGLETTLLFPARTQAVPLVIEILDDAQFEDLEYIDLHLSTDGQTPETLTIPINDNDPKPRKPERRNFLQKTGDFFQETGEAFQEGFIDPLKNSISTELPGPLKLLTSVWDSLRNLSMDDFLSEDAQFCFTEKIFEVPVFKAKVGPSLCVTGDFLGQIIEPFLVAGQSIVDYLAENAGLQTIHGFVDDAVIFVDRNFNGVLDFVDLNANGIQDAGEASEPTFSTAYDGSISLALTADMDTDRNGQFDDNEFQFVAIGGTDISTGYDITVPMSAPASYSIVSPLSTLVAKQRSLNGGDVQEAESRLAEAFGLPSTGYLRANSIILARDGDLVAAKAFANSTQVYSTAHQVASFLSGIDSAPSVRLLGSLVMTDMAEKLLSDSSLLDLTEPFVIESVIRGTLARSGMNAVNSELIAAAATVIANSNSAIGSVNEPTGRSFVEELVRVQKVSEGIAAQQLKQLSLGSVSPNEIVEQFSASNLDQLVANAEIGNVVVPYVVADDVSIIEGDNGSTLAVFNVGISDASNLPVTVHYSTDDFSAIAGEDYESISGQLTWAPGDTTVYQIQVPILGDTLSETDERFHLLLTNAVNAAVLETVSYGDIISDDAAGFVASDNSVDHDLVLDVDSTRLRLFDNGSVAFEGAFEGGQEFVINSVDGVRNDLTVVIQPDSATPANGIRFVGNGVNSSLTIDASYAASIDHIQYSDGNGRFVIDGATKTSVRSSPSPALLCRAYLLTILAMAKRLL